MQKTELKMWNSSFLCGIKSVVVVQDAGSASVGALFDGGVGGLLEEAAGGFGLAPGQAVDGDDGLADQLPFGIGELVA